MCLKNFLSSFSRTQVHYHRIDNSNVIQLCNALALFAVGRQRPCYGLLPSPSVDPGQCYTHSLSAQMYFGLWFKEENIDCSVR